MDDFDQDPPGRNLKARAKRKPKKRTGQQSKKSTSDVDWLAFLDENDVEYEIVSDHSAVLDECPCCGDAQQRERLLDWQASQCQAWSWAHDTQKFTGNFGERQGGGIGLTVQLDR